MKISIVIPTFNEEKNIQQLIYYLKKNSNVENIEEIIVADGKSADSTMELAREAGAKVFVSENKRRSLQMNIGAHHAAGDIFYFLHADTFPPKNFDIEIIRQVNNNFEAGCFFMKFDNNHFFMKFWGWMTKFTGAYFRGGDQSLFITRTLFETVNGYNEQMGIMEDYDIVSRVRDKTCFAVIKNRVTTSARKYEKVGMYSLQFKFAMIYVMYGLGFSQNRLLNYYFNNIEKQDEGN